VRATLDELKSRAGRAERTEESEGGDFGLSVEPLTPEVARELDLSKRTEGVVVRSVDPDGAAAAAGLRAGDVISKVNGQAVTTPAELKAALGRSNGKPALLLVTRENADLFLTLRKSAS
jgi:serine protease Do